MKGVFIRGTALAAIVCAGWLVTASAHHGGALDWNFDEQVGPVKAVATKFGFRFPHVQIFADMPGEDGEVRNMVFITRWTPTILRNHGWTRKSIQPGDELAVTYFRHQSNPDAGTIIRIEVNGELLETNIE